MSRDDARAAMVRAFFEHSPDAWDAHPTMSAFKRTQTPRVWGFGLGRCKPGEAANEIICDDGKTRELVLVRHGQALCEVFGGPVRLVVERSELVLEPKEPKGQLSLGLGRESDGSHTQPKEGANGDKIET